MNNEPPNEMSEYSIIRLLDIMTGTKPDSRQHQLAKIELKKREMAEQHELNNQLIEQQHKLNLQILAKQSNIAIWAIIVGFVGVILGAFLTMAGPIILKEIGSLFQKEAIEKTSQQKIENFPIGSLKREVLKDNAQPVTKEKNVLSSSNKKSP